MKIRLAIYIVGGAAIIFALWYLFTKDLTESMFWTAFILMGSWLWRRKR